MLLESRKVSPCENCGKLTNRSGSDVVDLVDTHLSSLEPDEDFLSVWPVFHHSSSGAAYVVADFFDGGVASHRGLDGVLVKVSSIVVGQEDSSHIEVDVEPSNVLLLPDSDDVLCHWGILIRSILLKGVVFLRLRDRR